jgi:hypothetical protein
MINHLFLLTSYCTKFLITYYLKGAMRVKKRIAPLNYTLTPILHVVCSRIPSHDSFPMNRLMYPMGSLDQAVCAKPTSTSISQLSFGVWWNHLPRPDLTCSTLTLAPWDGCVLDCSFPRPSCQELYSGYISRLAQRDPIRRLLHFNS